MRKVSQRHIAEHLKVSQALVSLVLNGKREGVSSETYERIWAYAEAVGYRASGRDKRLDGNALATVGYLLRSPLRLAATSNFFSEVHDGLDQYLVGNLGRTTYLGSEDEIGRRPLGELIRRDPGFRGLVIMGEVGDACLDALLGLECPLVYVSARAPGLCHSINANEAAGAILLADHLLALGHRRFAFLGIEKERSRAVERERAFAAALRRRGIGADAILPCHRAEAERHHGWEAAEELLALPADARPTAWIGVGGMIARGALDALQRRARDLEAPVTVASLDLTRICFDEAPRITAVGVHPDQLGREAGRLLLSLGPGTGIFRDLALPPELVVGETSFPAAG